MYNIYQKYRSIIIILVKLLIVSAAFYFISKKIINAGSFSQSCFAQQIGSTFIQKPWILFSILGFTLANWVFEILKWKTLVSSIKNISFFEAFKQSTSSLTASLLTPNRIGEYGAKAIYYDSFQRKKVMFLNLIGNLSQMFITIIFGIFGFIILYEYLNFTIDIQKVNGYLIIGLILLVGFLFYRFKNYIRTRFVLKTLNYFREIPLNILGKSIQYSFFRYLIFSHQFYFLLMLFGVELDYFIAMGAVFSMYFIASVIPGFVVFDFIVKGSIAISVFGIFGVPDMVVLGVTTIMWLLNFALPAIIGSYYVFAFELPATAKVIVK